MDEIKKRLNKMKENHVEHENFGSESEENSDELEGIENTDLP